MTVEVVATPSVDIVKPEVEKPAPKGEESMRDYAARVEAEMRGEKLEPKEAPAAAPEKSAAATEEEKAAAAATEKAAEEAKQAAALAAEGDPDKQLEDAHPAKKGISKRFGELTAEREKAKAEAKAKAEEAAAARKEAEEAKAEVEKLKAEAKKAAEAPIPVVPKPEDDPAPKRDAYEDPDAYERAAAEHAARGEIRKANAAAEARAKADREADAAKQEEERQKKVQEQITVLHKTFNERVEKSKPDYPDYDAKVTNNEKLILRNDVFFTIEQCELAPHILYHLSEHPEEAASLNNMAPSAAYIRLGEIQAELRIARKPKPSKASEPIKPVRARSSPERKTPDEESMQEYAARVEREEAAKRAARRGQRVVN